MAKATASSGAGAALVPTSWQLAGATDPTTQTRPSACALPPTGRVEVVPQPTPAGVATQANALDEPSAAAFAQTPAGPTPPQAPRALGVIEVTQRISTTSAARATRDQRQAGA